MDNVNFFVGNALQNQINKIYYDMTTALDMFNQSAEHLTKLCSLRENNNYDTITILLAKYNCLKELLGDPVSENEYVDEYIFDFYIQPDIIATIHFHKETGNIVLSNSFEYLKDNNVSLFIDANKK